MRLVCMSGFLSSEQWTLSLLCVLLFFPRVMFWVNPIQLTRFKQEVNVKEAIISKLQQEIEEGRQRERESKATLVRSIATRATTRNAFHAWHHSLKARGQMQKILDRERRKHQLHAYFTSWRRRIESLKEASDQLERGNVYWTFLHASMFCFHLY